MNHTAAFLSTKRDWETPQAFFEHWDEQYGFTLDAAASAANRKCDAYLDEAIDALSQPWPGVVWCNPPYSHGIGAWVRKGYEEAERGSTVVMLIPARTDTGWWHDYVMRAAEIWLVRGRIRFSGSPINAPFPSCVVVFHRVRAATPEFYTIDRYPKGAGHATD